MQPNSSHHPPQPLASSGQRLRGVPQLSGDRLLAVSLRYSLLTFAALSIYTFINTLFGISDIGTQTPWWVNLFALAALVPTILPLHQWLQRRVNELVYGQYDDPYRLLSNVSAQIEGASDLATLLSSVAATVATTIKLPYVALATLPMEEGVQASYGELPRDAELIEVPLAYRGSLLGSLQVSARHPGERLSADDLRLVYDLARQVGITLHAAQLTEALQSSRAELVWAREEERRRIRRDLHDGLGPALASLRLQLSALRYHVGDNPAALSLIDELRRDVRTATGEIRRLVYDLRPPMLDEFGLLGALRNLELSDDQLCRTVEAPEPLPPLPAALEVAVYRITAEALHNVIRHARATTCTIRLAFDDNTLTLTVRDDGVGLPTGYLPGVGHHALHERAAELGGSVTIERAREGGTCVTATFPLKRSADD